MKKILLSCTLAFATLLSFAQNLPVAAFETWHNISIGFPATQFPCPNGWSGSDSIYASIGLLSGQLLPFAPGLAKETPGNAGSTTALKVMTVNQPEIIGFFPASTVPTFATNGQISIDFATQSFSILGGFPFTEVPHSVSMWVKNNVLLNDTTQINIESIDDGDALGIVAATADTLLWNSISTYTKITLPLNIVDATVDPTHLRISITSSSDNSDTSYAGTYIIVDDIQVNYPSGVQQYLYSSKVANVYPTLFNNNLNVNLNIHDSKQYEFIIYDLFGKIVFKKSIQQEINSIDLATLPSSLYIYHVYSNDKLAQVGKLQKQ